jgi:hypothetical protein
MKQEHPGCRMGPIREALHSQSGRGWRVGGTRGSQRDHPAVQWMWQDRAQRPLGAVARVPPTLAPSLIATTTQRKTSSDAIKHTQGPEGPHRSSSLRVEERSAPVEAHSFSCGVLHGYFLFRSGKRTLTHLTTVIF